MKTTLFVTACIAALISTSAIAQPAATIGNRACLRFGEIYNWKALDNKTLIVEDNWHRKFRLGLMGYCEGLQFKERVGFKSRGSTSLSCMDPGDDILINQTGTGPQRCPIATITNYTPDMEKADAAAKAAASH